MMDKAIPHPSNTFPGRIHFFLFSLSWMAFAIYGSLVPLNFRPLDFHEAVDQFSKLPYLDLGIRSRADWVANILLFIPLGYLALGSLTLDRKGWFWQILAVPVILFCAFLSIGIEFIQQWFPPRTTSQNDIVAETIGSFLGTGLWILTGQVLTDWVRKYFSNLRPKNLIQWLLQFYLFGFLIYSFLPLDLTISAADLYRKYSRGRIAIIPFSNQYPSTFNMVYVLITDVLAFIPVGCYCATALTRKNKPMRSLPKVVFWGMLIAMGIELIQLIVYSRYTATTDIITGTLGVWIGGLIARHFSLSKEGREEVGGSFFISRSSLIWIGISILYMVFLVIGFWYPFDFISDKEIIKNSMKSFFRVPFSGMYKGSEFKAAGQILRKGLFFLPLGIFLTQFVRGLRIPTVIRPIILGILTFISFIFACGLELGQIVIKSHIADVTDVFLYTSGILLGIFLALRFNKSLNFANKNKQPQRIIDES